MLDIADNTRSFFNDFTISELANYVKDEDWLHDISQPNYTIEHEIITLFSEEDLIRRDTPIFKFTKSLEELEKQNRYVKLEIKKARLTKLICIKVSEIISSYI
jgi:hypothetical protein